MLINLGIFFGIPRFFLYICNIMTREEFLEKAISRHGSKYIYNKVPMEFKANDHIKIICPIHGEFEQSARSHYRRNGCPKCGLEKSNVSNLMNTDSFLEKYRKKFGEKYDTSLVEYVNSETKVKMICGKHGVFEKTPHSLMKGEGCPQCGRESSVSNRSLKWDDVLKKAIDLYHGKYSYDKFIYKKIHGKGIITCPIHGDFEKTMSKHLLGQGCPKCARESLSVQIRKPLGEVIKECEIVHGGKYSYVLDFEYVNNKSYLHAVCPTHGDFWQEINGHLRGQGCPKCGQEAVSNKLRKGKDKFVEEAREVHGDKYSYDNFEYVNVHTKGFVTCPIHGDFSVMPLNHVKSGSGCPKCVSSVSKWEKEIYDYISSLGVECEQSNRSILGGLEIDIYLPKYKIGIECDGLRWHNELFKDKNYHLDKTNTCREKGVRLIHIFEDEWVKKSEIWKSMLRNMLGKSVKKVYARKCELRSVSSKDVREFLDGNHIQGHSNSRINYGLYYNGELVSLMTFGLPRINLGGKIEDGHFELVRFCNKVGINVIGAASKLFKHFIDENDPIEVVSYSDKRWSLGNLYEILGFVHSHDSNPNYFYVDNMERINRFRFRKSMLVKEGYDANKSEHEIMTERGIYRIYDCGTMVWKWKNNKNN